MVSMWVVLEIVCGVNGVVLDIVCDVKVGSVRDCLWCQGG